MTTQEQRFEKLIRCLKSGRIIYTKYRVYSRTYVIYFKPIYDKTTNKFTQVICQEYKSNAWTYYSNLKIEKLKYWFISIHNFTILQPKDLKKLGIPLCNN